MRVDMYRKLGIGLGLIFLALVGQAAMAQSVLQDLGIQPGLSRVGEATQAEGGPSVSVANGAGSESPSGVSSENAPNQAPGKLMPFGADLFIGKAPALTQTANPDYRIQPGDQIAVHAWGGVTLDTVAPVDQDGNIFLPTVGPLKVGGVRAADLQSTVANSAQGTFTNKVNVYAVLLSTHQVGVYVTGFVNAPGRYGGIASDSVLDFLVRAGGIDPSRGSFRDILVEHDGRLKSRIDLYDFLLSGHLPEINLNEGDTIFVQHQHPTVAVPAPSGTISCLKCRPTTSPEPSS